MGHTASDGTSPVVQVTRVTPEITLADRIGTLKTRLGIGRMNYSVSPGLYAMGNPTVDSHVFLSANFKLSFDILRQGLAGMDAWLLVLDTKGINVWCAAGKGTFGTDEIVNRVAVTGLERVVSHRRLIVPQLGAPGVAAHEVRRRTGFSVIYGPVRSRDIKAFLDAGMKATPEMRRVRFPLYDRLVLTPIEVANGGKYFLAIAAIFFLLSGLNRSGYAGDLLISNGSRSTVNLLLAFLGGTVLSPILLPWVPGRSFAFKGLLVGLVLFLVSFFNDLTGQSSVETVAWLLLIPAIASFITLNFTGVSTYTSPSGVRKEMRIAIPAQLGAAILGICLWIAGRFVY